MTPPESGEGTVKEEAPLEKCPTCEGDGKTLPTAFDLHCEAAWAHKFLAPNRAVFIVGKSSVSLPVSSISDIDPAVDCDLGEWLRQVNEIVFHARVAARAKGYALAVHGTLRRDIDVIAVPWTEEACSPDELAQHIADSFARFGVGYEGTWDAAKGSREVKPHGRIAWSIPVKWKFHTGGEMYLDLSVVLPQEALEHRGGNT